MKADKNYCVYKHTCPNGKVYIGITSKEKPEYRWNYGYGYIRQTLFWNAIQKYGWENIKHEILFDNLSKTEAEQKEIEMIANYKSTNREYGYNLSTGGKVRNAGCTVSDETRAKLSLALSGENNPMYGRTGELNPMFGKHHADETKQKISNSRKGKYCGEDNGFYGKCHKEESKYWKGKHLPKETREKISKAHDNDKKKVAQIDKNTNEVIIIYPSIMEAARIVGVNESAIIRVCKGKQHTSMGYKWEYVI